MQELERQIQKLDQLDKYWIRAVEEKTEENEALDKEIRIFFKIAKKEYKENKDAVEQLLDKYYGMYASILINEIKEMLKIYYALSEFRQIQENNLEKGERILDYIFENGILRFDPEFHKQYRQYGFETAEELIRTGQVLIALTRYYVEHRFTICAMQNDLQMETNLKQSICEYFANLIDKNYLQLQLSMVLASINERTDNM